MKQRIRELSASKFADTVSLRRQFHRRPELAFNEFETAALVAATLAEAGIPTRTGVGRTGVVGTVTGGLPGPDIVLRADMDALPIHEENAFEFRSEVPGVMHACGHDAHTASLLTTAAILHEIREDLPGTVRLIFQPSEERVPGGALGMIADGVLDPSPAHVFGQHVRPDLPVGVIGIRSGSFMASADEITITVFGQGGHAAEPHRLSGDAVTAAATIITSLQTIVSRNAPPGIPTVISFGRISADGAQNVIPDRVVLEGTLRSMDNAWRTRAQELIVRVAEHTASALGTRAEIDILRGYPPLVNHPASSDLVRRAACAFVGEQQVIDLDEWYVAEDFAYYLRESPGCFYVIGSGNESSGITHGLHTARFTVEEEALRTSPGFMAFLAWQAAVEATAR